MPEQGRPSPNLTLHAIVVLCFLATGAVLAILWLRPNADNTTLIATVLGFLGTTTAALLSLIKATKTDADLRDLTVQINGRLNQLLDQTARASHAEGKAEGRAEGASHAIVATAAPAIAAAVTPVVAAAVAETVVPAVVPAVKDAVKEVVTPPVTEGETR